MAIPAVLLGPDERFELVVGEEGILPIPETLRGALRLKPGEIEIVAVDRLPASLFLETFSAFLDALGEAVPVEQQWDQVVQRFFTRTLVVLEERGLPIPADLFPLPVGATLRLQVLHRGLFPELYVYPAEVSAVRQDLAIEPEN